MLVGGVGRLAGVQGRDVNASRSRVAVGASNTSRRSPVLLASSEHGRACQFVRVRLMFENTIWLCRAVNSPA